MKLPLKWGTCNDAICAIGKQNIVTHSETNGNNCNAQHNAHGFLGIVPTSLVFFFTCSRQMNTRVQHVPIHTHFLNRNRHPTPFPKCRGLVGAFTHTTGRCTPSLLGLQWSLHHLGHRTPGLLPHTAPLHSWGGAQGRAGEPDSFLGPIGRVGTDL